MGTPVYRTVTLGFFIIFFYLAYRLVDWEYSIKFYAECWQKEQKDRTSGTKRIWWRGTNTNRARVCLWIAWIFGKGIRFRRGRRKYENREKIQKKKSPRYILLSSFLRRTKGWSFTGCSGKSLQRVCEKNNWKVLTILREIASATDTKSRKML